MFAVFIRRGKKKIRFSDEYTVRQSAHELSKLLNARQKGEPYYVRQFVRPEGEKRGKWQDL